MGFNEGMSPADLAAVTRNNDGMFGGNGVWWIIILFLFAFLGWGGGYGGNGTQGAANNYVLASDFATIQRQLSDGFGGVEKGIDTVRNGLCDGFYTTAQQFNTTNTNVMQGFNATQAAIKDCCCQTQQNIKDTQYAIGSIGAEISRGVERGFADTNYNLATQANGLTNTISNGFCQTNFNNQTNTRDIIDTQRADTQAILAKLDSMETNRLREKLEAERDAKYALQGQLDRAKLRTDIVNDVRPCPIPAYPACNPWGCNCQQNVYGTTIA